MQQISDIERQAAEAVSHLIHHDDQGNTMTTPAPDHDVLADVDQLVTDLRANGLISRLYGSKLGSLLNADQIDHVTAIVQAIEAGRQPATAAAAELPQRVPQPPAAPVTVQ
jgi:hypothetical protein